MMTKWNKLCHDCKPEEGKYVLVSFLIGDERLLYNCVVAKLGENEYGDTSWDDGFNFYPIDDTDRWAYIELPED